MRRATRVQDSPKTARPLAFVDTDAGGAARIGCKLQPIGAQAHVMGHGRFDERYSARNARSRSRECGCAEDLYARAGLILWISFVAT
jgi:hypothetical protein